MITESCLQLLMIDSLPKAVHHLSEQVSTMFRGHTWGEGSRASVEGRHVVTRCF